MPCEGAQIAIYEYHRDSHTYPTTGATGVECQNSPSASSSSSSSSASVSSLARVALSRDTSDPSDTCEREVVVLAAGCANSVSIYDMLDEKSLPEFLYSNGFDVWALDLRGLDICYSKFISQMNNNYGLL